MYFKCFSINIFPSYNFCRHYCHSLLSILPPSFFSLFILFLYKFKRKTQLTSNIQILLTVPLTTGKDRSHCVPTLRDTYSNMALSGKLTLLKIRSIKLWSNQPSTPPFVMRFQISQRDREKCSEYCNEST